MQMMGMSPEVMQRLMGARQDEPRPRPLMEAQQMDLRDKLQKLQQSTPVEAFAPGMFVREKLGLNLVKDEDVANTALMFVRELDFTEPLDLALASAFIARGMYLADRIDCLVALLMQGTMTFLPHDSRRLEILPNQTCLGDDQPPS